MEHSNAIEYTVRYYFPDGCDTDMRFAPAAARRLHGKTFDSSESAIAAISDAFTVTGKSRDEDNNLCLDVEEGGFTMTPSGWTVVSIRPDFVACHTDAKAARAAFDACRHASLYRGDVNDQLVAVKGW